MKKLITLFAVLIILPLCASGQQRINRDIAGLTLGRCYRSEKIEDILWDKYTCFPRVHKESSSTSIIAVGIIPFAGETWDCLNITQTSSGRVSEVLFGKEFKDKDKCLSFCTRMAEMIVKKYGAPVSYNKEDLAFEWIWSDSKNTTLQLQAIGEADAEESTITVWLSYSDDALMRKIQADAMDEL